MKSHITFRKIVTNILTLFAGTAMARALSAVTLIIIARLVGPDAFGQYSASMALVTLSSTLFSLGLDGWLMYEGGRQREMLSARLTSAVLLKVSLGMVWLAGLWTMAPFLNRSSFPWMLVVLGSLSVWLEEIARTVMSAFKACLRNNMTLVLMTWLQGVFLVATLWLVYHHAREPAAYLAARLLATLLGAAAAFLLATRQIGWRLQWKTLGATLRGMLPFAASTALTTINRRAGLTIVANELGKQAAGVYGPALTLTNALFLIPAALFGVMLPALSQTNPRWIRQLSSRLVPGMALLGLVMGATLTWLAVPLVKLLYGEAFQASAEVVSILGGVLALRFPNVALAAAIVAVGWQSRRVGVQALSAALNILLNFLVVHQLGVIGVAKVYVLSEAVLFLGYLSVYVLWMRKERQAADFQTSC